MRAVRRRPRSGDGRGFEHCTDEHRQREHWLLCTSRAGARLPARPPAFPCPPAALRAGDAAIETQDAEAGAEPLASGCGRRASTAMISVLGNRTDSRGPDKLPFSSRSASLHLGPRNASSPRIEALRFRPERHVALYRECRPAFGVFALIHGIAFSALRFADHVPSTGSLPSICFASAR